MKRLLFAVFALSCLTAPAWSAKVKVWNQTGAAAYDKAEFKQSVLTNHGALRLARELKPFADLDAAHIWALAEDGNGNLYAATGNEGKVFRVSSEGKATVVYQSDDSQVLSLAIGGDGSVYAGTGPSGLVIKIPAKGEAKEFCKTGDAYVWSLAFDGKCEALYAATGPKGRIHKIDKDGKRSLFYATKQEHVLCVAFGTDDQLYAGTGKRGLVYRIDAQGKGFVLVETPQSEVRTLLVTKEGIFAGTSSPVGRKAPGVGDKSDKSSGDKLDLGISRGKASPRSEPSVLEKDDVKTDPPTPLKDSGGTASSREAAVPGVPPPSAKDNSVYRIAYDGTVREVFREKAMVLALALAGDRLLVATGGDGQLFEVRPFERERTELVRVDHTQIHSLLRRGDGSLVLGTGDPGKLYVLRDQFAAKGAIQSDVLDAKLQSTWGSLRWKADQPQGTHVSVSVRSGNVADPDDTWSEWSAEQADSETAMAKAPPARFFQYRVTLRTDDPKVTPTVTSVAVRFATTNIAPDVSAIDVPDLNAVTLENPKKLKIKWTASDLNEDDLVYTLYYRKEGWKNWVELEADLEKREYEWDTTTTPAGVYQVKVVASDRRDNAPAEVLEGEKISPAFVIDHVAPSVTVKVQSVAQGRAMVEASAKDELSRLTSASYSLDGKKWVNVFPQDGLFDRKAAAFQFATGNLKPGTHVLMLRVTDASGNTGATDVAFEVEGK